MKFFIDTANLAQIKEAQALGVLDGLQQSIIDG
jgi:transaldolase